MAVKHRKLGRSKGDTALAELRAELKETIEAIQEEEGFAAQTGPGLLNTSDLAKRFPAVANRNATP